MAVGPASALVPQLLLISGIELLVRVGVGAGCGGLLGRAGVSPFVRKVKNRSGATAVQIDAE